MKHYRGFFFNHASFFSEQLEEESVLGVSIWLKLGEIMSSPPLHLTIPPPPSFTSPLYWLALLHHTGDPVERIFSLYKEKMQLRRLWDDRKDLLRASLPLTSDGHSRPLQHQIIWTVSTRTKFTEWTEKHLNVAGFHSLFYQSAWVTQDLNASILSFCAPSCSLDFVRRRLSAQFVLQVRGGGQDRWLRWRYKGLTTFCTPFYRFVVSFNTMHPD